MILVLGDTHFPFASDKALKALYRFAAKISATEPITHMVQVGDLYDFYSCSKFPASRDLMTPVEEIRRGRSQAEAFWAKLQDIAPDAR